MNKYFGKTILGITLCVGLLLTLGILVFATGTAGGANSAATQAAGTAGTSTAAVKASGETGGLTWTLYTDGLLEITGEGAMPEYTSSTSVPWSSYRTTIKSVDICEGVTSIGGNAFFSCSGLTSITIPGSVTSIGSQAFWGCFRLTLVTIPDSVTSIGYRAFYGCTSLISATIPDSVTYVGVAAFGGCSSLIEITVTDGNTAYCSSSNCLIELATKTLIAGCKNSVIPTDGSVTSIGTQAFYGCRGLTSIAIPDSIMSIGTYAFSYCSGLTSITVADGNTAYHSADNCLIETATKTLVLGCKSSVIPVDGSVISIGDYAFYGCSDLASITIPDGVTRIGDSAFRNCTGLISVTVGKGVASIGTCAFDAKTAVIYCDDNPYVVEYCKSNGILCYRVGEVAVREAGTTGGLTWTLYTDGLLEITGEGAMSDYEWNAMPWYDYRSLITSVNIGDGVTSIGRYAFSGCKGLTSITIPGSVTSIGDSALSNCIGLSLIAIPDRVASIGSLAFSGCTGLTSITIPGSVTSIGDSAFSGCTGLTSVTIESGVTSTGYQTFYGCTGLTSIAIPDSVTSIGSWTFAGCTGLTSVTIGSGVTSISNFAFYCTGLTEITVAEENSKYHSSGNCVIETATKTLIVGCKTGVIPADGSVTCIGSFAFSGCSGLTSIAIPDSVTHIGDGAFFGCSGLTSITVADGNTAYHSDGNCLIKTATKTLLRGCNNSVIPADGSVTHIDDGAFSDCIGLTSITIPAGVTSIGTQAFWNCSGLTSITIPDSVTSIGNYAFSGCTALTSATIGSGVMGIGAGAFDGADNLVIRSRGNSYVEDYCKTNNIEYNDLSFIYGDATGDGQVNINDIVRLKKYIAAYDYVTETSTVDVGAGADANGDGIIDALDIVRLQKYLANYDYGTGTSTVVLGPQK